MKEHRPRKLLDQVRDAIRLKHYSYRTEQAYVGWIKRLVLYHIKRHPLEMGRSESASFSPSWYESTQAQHPLQLHYLIPTLHAQGFVAATSVKLAGKMSVPWAR